MEESTVRLNLGTVLCKHCMKIIDTLDTKRVKKFYVECDDQACIEKRTSATADREKVGN